MVQKAALDPSADESGRSCAGWSLESAKPYTFNKSPSDVLHHATSEIASGSKLD
jgi:hypothetical protein